MPTRQSKRRSCAGSSDALTPNLTFGPAFNSSEESPQWVPGNEILFQTPKSPPRRNQRKTIMITQETMAVGEDKQRMDRRETEQFKVPSLMFSSPPGVKTRSRRSSMYVSSLPRSTQSEFPGDKGRSSQSSKLTNDKLVTKVLTTQQERTGNVVKRAGRPAGSNKGKGKITVEKLLLMDAADVGTVEDVTVNKTYNGNVSDKIKMSKTRMSKTAPNSQKPPLKLVQKKISQKKKQEVKQSPESKPSTQEERRGQEVHFTMLLQSPESQVIDTAESLLSLTPEFNDFTSLRTKATPKGFKTPNSYGRRTPYPRSAKIKPRDSPTSEVEKIKSPDETSSACPESLNTRTRNSYGRRTPYPLSAKIKPRDSLTSEVENINYPGEISSLFPESHNTSKLVELSFNENTPTRQLKRKYLKERDSRILVDKKRNDDDESLHVEKIVSAMFQSGSRDVYSDTKLSRNISSSQRISRASPARKSILGLQDYSSENDTGLIVKPLKVSEARDGRGTEFNLRDSYSDLGGYKEPVTIDSEDEEDLEFMLDEADTTVSHSSHSQWCIIL